MSQFSTALRQCLDRSFAGKIIALASASGLPDPEIGRLLREQTPLTAPKLEKLVTAEGMTADDRTLLVHAAVRDFVGDEEYKNRFAPSAETSKAGLTESLGGPVFRSLFPLSQRAEQVLRYIVNRAGHDNDLSKILELMGNFLELPPPEPGADVEELIDQVASEMKGAKPPSRKSAKHGKAG